MAKGHLRGALPAIFLISAVIISLEIVWTRLLAITMYHHFAHMVIGVSMAGFGASGALLVTSFIERRDTRSVLTWSARLFALSVFAGLPILVRTTADPVGIIEGVFTLKELFFSITIVHLIMFLTFLFAGLFIGCCISRFGREVNRFYAVDLVGAAVGCLLAVIGLLHMEAPDVVLAGGALGAIASVLVSGRWKRDLMILAPVLIVIGIWGSTTNMEVEASRRKVINYFRNEWYPGKDVIETRWHPLGRIEVFEEVVDNPWVAGYVSPEYEKVGKMKVPQISIFGDGHFLTPIFKCNGNVKDLGFLEYMLHSFPYQILKKPEVFVVGFGGGVDLYAAQYFGASHTKAVDVNPVIRDILLNEYQDYTGGIFQNESIETYTAEGRHFISQMGPNEKYDLIQLTAVDTFTALASGAYAVSENYLYTVEAFRAYLEHLKPDGLLSFIRQEFIPPRETMRLLTIAAEAHRRGWGPDPREHLVIVDANNKTYAIFMFKESPYTKEEVATLAKHAELLNFRLLYDPFHTYDNPYGHYLQAKDRREFLDSYRYDVTPTTDNRPYFFQFSRLNRLFDWKGRPDEHPPVSVPTALWVVIAWSIEILVLGALFIIVPLWIRVREGAPRHKWGTVWYFSCLGIAFMAVELTLMQKMTLYLGNPVWAISTVLFCLLVFSGLGSFLGGRLRLEGAQIFMILGGVVLLVLAAAFGIGVVTHATLRFPLAARFALTLAMIAPLGLLMGMPFPSGIRLLDAKTPKLIPIAWGANAFASTLGAALTAFFSVIVGFQIVFVAAAVVYGMAAGAVMLVKSSS